MSYKRLIPCIFILGGKAVKWFDDPTVVSEDVIALAKEYSDNGADELLVFDLSSTDQDHDESIELMKKINRVIRIPMVAGGNVKRQEDVKKILYTGAKRAMLNFSKPDSQKLIDRGFSYRVDAPLDMRMDTRQTLSAKEIVNGYSEMDLFRIIRDYGEDKFAKNIAKHIVMAREKGPIETTGQLAEIIRQSIPMKFQKMSGHPAKRTFQAIRIECNRELEVLRDSLDDMIDILNPGGRICIITFHSLEDRIVKGIFKKNENPCTCPSTFPVCVCGKVSKGKVITKKPILPSEEEMEVNSRSKSAKLRIFERV